MYKRWICTVLMLALVIRSESKRGNEKDDQGKKRVLTRSWWKNIFPSKSADPLPTIVHDFITTEEAEILLKRYTPLLRQSMHSNLSSTGRYRTSRSIRLAPLGHDLVFDIERRAAALAGKNHSQVEDLQLACYENDELYGLHRDDHENGAANRETTVLVYLRVPEEGGSTLFTRKPLEDEVDLDTHKPLNSEAAALKLFRSYCNKPQKKHINVEPSIGTAVMWNNWYMNEDGIQTFSKSSTHGACPVIKGQKCVIQQWIRKTGTQPLRDNRVAAIFPAGADVSYDKDQRSSIHGCLPDASSQQGRKIPSLCSMHNQTLTVLNASYGPYQGLGALRVDGLVASMPTDMFSSVTVSFWARNFKNKNILSFLKVLSIRHVQYENKKDWIELSIGDLKTHFELDYKPQDWLWFSLTFSKLTESANLRIYSVSGILLGEANIDSHNDFICSDDYHEKRNMDLNLMIPTSDSQIEHKAEISFLVIHDAILDEKERIVLRRQAMRYDVST